MKPQASPALALRMGLLALAGAIEGLLMANGPVLERYAALRFGTDGFLLDLDLLFLLVFAAAGVAAALATWSHAAFATLVAAAASWSLSESSLHPFWLLSKKTQWRPHDPSGALLAAHVLAIALVCAAALVQALRDSRRAATAQRIDDRRAREDTGRLATAGGLLLLGTLAVGVPVALLLDNLAHAAAGSIAGRTSFGVLLASAIALLVGLALLTVPRKDPGAQRDVDPAAKPP